VHGEIWDRIEKACADVDSPDFFLLPKRKQDKKLDKHKDSLKRVINKANNRGLLDPTKVADFVQGRWSCKVESGQLVPGTRGKELFSYAAHYIVVCSMHF